jgi:hypothetical protein
VCSTLSYEAKIAEQINQNPRRFYNYARSFTKGISSVNCRKVNGELLTTNQDKAGALNDFFATVMVNERDGIPYFPYRGPSSRKIACIG